MKPIYKNNEYLDYDYKWYGGKGFCGYETIIEGGIIYSQVNYCEKIEENHIGQDSLNSILEIIDFCEKNHIQLTLYSASMPDFLLANIEYDEYIKQVEEVLNFLDLNEMTDYYDDDHLSYLGAEKFSKAFGELFANTNDIHEAVEKGDVSNIYLTEEYFYSSYQEKFDSLGNVLLGVYITDENGVYQIESVMAGSVEPEYEIILENEVLKFEDDIYDNVIEELTVSVKNDTFQLPEKYEGVIKPGITVDGMMWG